jgi:hypothetical protein
MANFKNTTVNDTGYLRLPVGTTAQRPGSPVAGDMRWNSDRELIEFYDGTVWIGVGAFAAEGGTEIESGGYKIHTFTSPGGLVVRSGSTDAEVLIVAGGGGGGGGTAGGGGAGEIKYAGAYTVSVGNNPVTVGSGGGRTLPAGSDPAGNPGGSSSFNGITSAGGGGGGSYGTIPALSGGSGGGGTQYTNGNRGAAGSTAAPSGAFTGYGNPGGNVGGNGGGGGGGAANAGSTGGSGPGGNGRSYSISGTSYTYSGGGGGSQGGSGGSGGGGNAATTAQSANYYGGGGGGGWDYGAGQGGGGYPGIVIIKYPLQ